MTTATGSPSERADARGWRAASICGVALLGVAAAVRVWNALTGPLGWGYDAWGHIAYVLYIDLYHALPHADQGWSYFHPPLHYLLSWPLCWLGSAEALMRGMLLLASAASLATAALAFRVQGALLPGRPDLAWLACAALAFLPSQIASSAMPGNEMTAAFVASAAIAHWILAREPVPLRRDALTGALLGLALLSKHSAWIAVIAVFASLATQCLLAFVTWRRALQRAAVLTLAIGVVAGPLMLRNLVENGTLMPSSRNDPYVRAAEARQPPGVRVPSHYLRFSPQLFLDANPLAPHVYNSVWGSLYVNTWFDSHRETERGLLLDGSTPIAVRVLLVAGLLPTGLALLGVVLALRDVLQGRRREAYVPLLWLSAGMLAAQALFAWQMPTWAAVKGSYLLPASLGFALFLARGFEALSAWRPRVAGAVLGVLASAAALVAILLSDGLVLPRRVDSIAAGATHFYFGDYAAARRIYRGMADQFGGWPPALLDNQAATWIASGDDAELARKLYTKAAFDESVYTQEDTPSALTTWRRGQIAVATALAGDEAEALALLDAALEGRETPELRANRGVLQARAGRLAAAEADLAQALAADKEMLPAWEALAVVLRRMQRDSEADAALDIARRVACRAPRGYARGIGSGEVIEWGVGRRWLLRLDPEDGGISVALPAYHRDACARLAEAD